MSCLQIQRKLEHSHFVKTSVVSIWKFLKKYKENGFIHNKPRNSESRRRVKDIHLKIVNFWLRENSEMTAADIQQKLQETFNVTLSRNYVCKLRKSVGWITHRRSKYCQLISKANTQKRYNYALKMLREKETFQDVVFVDETTVEMNSHGKIFFYKPEYGMQFLQTKKQKPKHAYKVHVWAGISYRGRTHICIFTGIMDSIIYQKILADNFIPFVNSAYPDGYRLYQDNDSKHCSKSTKQWMAENGMLDKVMETPASSPDLNPIENVWAVMKTHLQTVIKPKKRDELVDGIVKFWETLTPQKCAKYIEHIHRVLPHVVLNEGSPTKF